MSIPLVDIRRIHSNKLAINGKTYIGDDGYTYTGQPNGRLLKNPLATNVDFKKTDNIDGGSVNSAIVNLDDRVEVNTSDIAALDTRVTQLEYDVVAYAIALGGL